MMLSIFSCALVGHQYMFFGEMSIRYFAHFSIVLFAFLLLSCLSCLYILEIKPLSVASFETIFSHSVSCLFVCLFVFSFLFVCLDGQKDQALVLFW